MQGPIHESTHISSFQASCESRVNANILNSSLQLWAGVFVPSVCRVRAFRFEGAVDQDHTEDHGDPEH
jgi:hypothetical protein